MSSSKRDKYIQIMVKKANKLCKRYTWEAWEEIWDMCSDWNSTHPETEEIFMAEHENDNGETDGFYIEDDYWIIHD